MKPAGPVKPVAKTAMPSTSRGTCATSPPAGSKLSTPSCSATSPPSAQNSRVNASRPLQPTSQLADTIATRRQPSPLNA